MTCANLLPLNSPKTEFRLISVSKQLTKINNSSPNTTHSARNLGFIFDEHLTFYRAMLCIRGTSHGPVSVRLSVTSRSSTKTAKCRITQTTPHDSPGTVVFLCQRSLRNSTGVTHTGAPNAGGVGQNRRLSANNRGYTSKTVQDRRIVSIKVE